MYAPQPVRDWQDLTTADFAGLDPGRTVVLLPVAAIEQHGPHLPLGTDAMINEGLVAAASTRLPARVPVLRLPALPIGDSIEHRSFAGTLAPDLDALRALWMAAGEAVARAGLQKLVIFNSHGGQKALVDQVAVRLRAAHGLLVVRAHSFALGHPPGLFPAEELAHGLHGGAVETSMMLHLRPGLVRTAAIGRFGSTGEALAARGGLLGAEKPIGFGWLAEDLNRCGACGDATMASAEKGRLLVEFAAQRLAALLAEVSALDWPAVTG